MAGDSTHSGDPEIVALRTLGQPLWTRASAQHGLSVRVFAPDST
jgi:hypothetical protein